MTNGIKTEIKIDLCSTFFKRLRGYMFQREQGPNEGKWLTPCNGVHMFFMKFPLDILFIDKENHIVAMYANVQPWSKPISVKHAFATIELPAGTINRYLIQPQQRVELNPEHDLIIH